MTSPFVLHDVLTGVYSVAGSKYNVVVKGIDMHEPGTLNPSYFDGIIVLSQRSEDMEFMNEAGQTVYLKVSVDELAKRLELCKSTRPVLKGRTGDELKAFVAESLEKREPFYSKAAIVFDAEEMMTDQDVHEISQELATRLSLWTDKGRELISPRSY